MQRENGFTLITLMFLLGLAIFVAMVAFKIVPTYMTYFTVKKSLENVVQDPSVPQTNVDLRSSLDKRLNVNFIQALDSGDLQIDKEDGMLVLTMPISSKEHLVGGVSISVDLEAKASAPLR